MKKIFLAIVLVLSMICTAKAQDAVNEPQQNEKYTYCEIVGTSNFTHTKVTVDIDFGQEINFWTQHEQRALKDENGNQIKFNSMIDALNYLGDKGWIFVQAYAITVGNTDVYHYLLKMPKDKVVEE